LQSNDSGECLRHPPEFVLRGLKGGIAICLFRGILTTDIPLSKSGRKRLFLPDFTPFYPLISDFDNGHTVVKIPIFIYWNAMIRETQAIFKPKP